VDAHVPTTAGPSLSRLELELRRLEARVRDLVELRRADDPLADDRFRGLYISDAEVDQLLAAESRSFAEPVPAQAWVDAPPETRLGRLATGFGLHGLDVTLLLIALAPDLDPRFERLYAYLNDDVSRRRATAGLALELCGVPLGSGWARQRLGEAGPLAVAGLILVEETDRPFLSRSLRVPDRVTAHLLGDDTPDATVAPLLLPVTPAHTAGVETLARALGSGVRIVHLRERSGGDAAGAALAALRFAGLPALAVDLRLLAARDDAPLTARSLVREARLRGAALVAGPVDALVGRHRDVISQIAESLCPVVLHGAQTWDPAWSREVPVTVDAPPLDVEERRRLWTAALGVDACDREEMVAVAVPMRLTAHQVERAAQAARRLAAAAGRPVRLEDLIAGTRAQNAAGLERLARRIQPAVGWDDLVLPAPVHAHLRDLTARVRHRDPVLGQWGMGRAPGRDGGTTALFAGESGTGKTMSAEVIAADLGLDLYVIDLSTVVDKYIGETEKNLDRIFDEADRVNGVLLFDEADALFGKRSEVRDAHDRYANIEVAYLLQRMEHFEGVAILTTNLRANLDAAFVRRLDAIVDFPVPDEEGRLGLWRRHLGPGVPRADDVDLAFLARSFRLTGGNIRSICLTAAYLAAGGEGRVGMIELVRATEREYQKLGRLCVEAEFGAYHALLGG
jgi:hypothetical protein